jgi:hypothetical protein
MLHFAQRFAGLHRASCHRHILVVPILKKDRQAGVLEDSKLFVEDLPLYITP